MKDLMLLYRRIEANSGQNWGRRRSHARKGEIKDGSCTDQVLSVLVKAAPKSMTRAEIVDATQAKPKSVDWALHYLRSIGMVESMVGGMSARSCLYLRWRAATPD